MKSATSPMCERAAISPTRAESLPENSSGSSSRFWRRCRRHHREPRTGDEPGGAEEFADLFHRRVTPAGA